MRILENCLVTTLLKKFNIKLSIEKITMKNISFKN